MSDVITRQNITLLDDSPYRDTALELTFDYAKRGKRALSLVDWVIRLVLDDPNVQVHALWTYNVGDFADVCQSRGIQLVSAG